MYVYRGEENETVPKTSSLISVHHSVKVIKRYAFKDCSLLEKIIMNDHVTRIEFGAFYYCVSLRNVVLPRNLEQIGSYAFHFCEKLHSVTIPDIPCSRIVSIGNFAFGFCSSLRHIEFSPALEYIGNSAFCRCSSLEAMFLPRNLVRIGNRAFHGCESLRLINIPETVADLPENIVHSCNKILTEIDYIRDQDTWELTNDDEVNEWIRHLHDGYPLHKECFKIDVTNRNIKDCINRYGKDHAAKIDYQQMTALHILCSNPRVTEKALMECFISNPKAAYMTDMEGSTPIHFLCRYNPSMVGEFISFGRLQGCLKTVNHEGITPVQILSENKSVQLLPIGVAIKQNIGWDEGVNLIMDKVWASEIGQLLGKDSETGLYLFRLAAVGQKGDLTTCFELLRIKPDHFL